MNNFRNLIILWSCQSRKFPLEYERKVEKLKRRNWFISKNELAKLREVRNIEWTNNSKIANFWSQTFLSELKKFWKFFIFQFEPLQQFSIWTTPTIFNLENFTNLQFGKFKKIQFGNFQKFIILKIKKKFNFKNSKLVDRTNKNK